MQQLRANGLGPQSIAADLGLNTAEVQAYMLGLTPTAIPGSMSGEVRRLGDHLRLIN